MEPRRRLLNEHLISLKSETTLGHKYSTLRNWCMVGLLDANKQRVRLETIKRGGIRVTSKEAIERFYERIS